MTMPRKKMGSAVVIVMGIFVVLGLIFTLLVTNSQRVRQTVMLAEKSAAAKEYATVIAELASRYLQAQSIIDGSEIQNRVYKELIKPNFNGIAEIDFKPILEANSDISELLRLGLDKLVKENGYSDLADANYEIKLKAEKKDFKPISFKNNQAYTAEKSGFLQFLIKISYKQLASTELKTEEYLFFLDTKVTVNILPALSKFTLYCADASSYDLNQLQNDAHGIPASSNNIKPWFLDNAKKSEYDSIEKLIEGQSGLIYLGSSGTDPIRLGLSAGWKTAEGNAASLGEEKHLFVNSDASQAQWQTHEEYKPRPGANETKGIIRANIGLAHPDAVAANINDENKNYKEWYDLPLRSLENEEARKNATKTSVLKLFNNDARFSPTLVLGNVAAGVISAKMYKAVSVAPNGDKTNAIFPLIAMNNNAFEAAICDKTPRGARDRDEAQADQNCDHNIRPEPASFPSIPDFSQKYKELLVKRMQDAGIDPPKNDSQDAARQKALHGKMISFAYEFLTKDDPERQIDDVKALFPYSTYSPLMSVFTTEPYNLGLFRHINGNSINKSDADLNIPDNPYLKQEKNPNKITVFKTPETAHNTPGEYSSVYNDDSKNLKDYTKLLSNENMLVKAPEPPPPPPSEQNINIRNFNFLKNADNRLLSHLQLKSKDEFEKAMQAYGYLVNGKMLLNGWILISSIDGSSLNLELDQPVELRSNCGIILEKGNITIANNIVSKEMEGNNPKHFLTLLALDGDVRITSTPSKIHASLAASKTISFPNGGYQPLEIRGNIVCGNFNEQSFKREVNLNYNPRMAVLPKGNTDNLAMVTFATNPVIQEK